MSEQSKSSSGEHKHHWLIGDQEGPSSEGVCRECGERREFSNSLTLRKSAWTTRSRTPKQDPPEGESEQ